MDGYRPRPRPLPLRRAAAAPVAILSLLLLLFLLVLVPTAQAFFHSSTGGAPAAAPPSPPPRDLPPSTRLHAEAHPTSPAALIARGMLLEGEREGTLVVSTGRFPLIGLPSWSPPLHVGVLLSVDERKGPRSGAMGGAAATAAAGVPGSGGGGFFLYDFVPAKPTSPFTALALFLGRRVPGVVREKLLVAATPKAIARKGRCQRSLLEIRAFCQAYDAQLSLRGNNCQSFADALLAFVLAEEEGEEDDGSNGNGGDDDAMDEDLEDAASILDWILDGDLD